MKRRIVIALAGTLAFATLLISTVAVSQANDVSPDVPAGTFFHDAAAAIVEARCATGFNDGTFRTNTDITRGQFAYWFNNCGTRAGFRRTAGPGIVLSLGYQEVLDVEMDIGGAPGGEQQLVVNAWYEIDDDGANCPCDIDTRLTLTPGGTITESYEMTTSVETGVGGDIDDSIQMSTLFFSVPTGTTQTIKLEGRVGAATTLCLGGCVSTGAGNLVVMTAPFEADGTGG